MKSDPAEPAEMEVLLLCPLCGERLHRRRLGHNEYRCDGYPQHDVLLNAGGPTGAQWTDAVTEKVYMARQKPVGQIRPPVPLANCPATERAEAFDVLLKEAGEPKRDGEPEQQWHFWCWECTYTFKAGEILVIRHRDRFDEERVTLRCPRADFEGQPCQSERFSRWLPEKPPRGYHPHYPDEPEPNRRYPGSNWNREDDT